MKKIIFAVSVLVLGFLFTSTTVSAATTKYAPGCTSATNYSATTGQKCIASGSVLGAYLPVTPDPTPRIMYWWGKVNQHIDVNGEWQTDPDGRSGANLDKLTYCKKWYPTTTSVVPYQSETISTWHDAGNLNNYTATITSDKCVTDTLPTPSVKVLSPNGGEVYQAGQQITVKWSTQNVPTGFRPSIVLDDRRTNSIGGIILASETVNDGVEVVNLPTASTWTNMPYGTFFKIRVAFAELGGAGPFVYMDESDNLITIQTPTPTAQCGDGVDNDSDGLIDYPTDPGCTSVIDNDETNAVATPSITVVLPNGGEMYQTGQQITVKWTTSNAPSDAVIIAQLLNTQTGYEMSLTPVTIAPIGFGTANDGQEVFTLLSAGDPLAGHTYDSFGNVFKMRLGLVSSTLNIPGQAISDYSNSTFTIQPPTTSTCTINSFAANPTTINSGGSSTLSWSTSDCTHVKLRLGNTGSDPQIVVPINGTYSTGPLNATKVYDLEAVKLIPGCSWIYGYSSVNGQSCNTTVASTGTAVIVNTTSGCSSSIPTLKLLSPNGGESYQSGQQVLIKWSACNMPSGAVTRLLLARNLPNNVQDGLLILESTSNYDINIGSYLWTIPNTITPASNYFMTIVCGIGGANCVTGSGNNTYAITDGTDGTFSINTGTSYPAGCTSNLGYSVTTGIPCTNPVTWVVGCTSANAYSSITGQSCNWTPIIPNLPLGCATSTGYSATTGRPCFGTTGIYCPTNASPKVTVLAPNGGESYQPAQQALVTWKTCKIPANTMMRIDLVMSQPNGGTVTRIIKNTINDGTETITLPTTATWTPMVYGNNFKIKVRKLVGNGNNLPQDFSDTNFQIAPITLTVAPSTSTPPAQIVQVSNTATTNDVTLLKFTLKASGSDLAIDKIPVFVSATGVSSNDLDQMADTLTLKIDGDEYDESVSTNNVGSAVITFDNLDYNIDDGETVTVEVLADIDNIHTGFGQGDTLTASIRPSEVATIDVEEETGDQLTTSQKIGSAMGNPQTYRSFGIVVTPVSATSGTIYNGGNYGNHVMKIKVTAFGDDAYLDRSLIQSTSMAAVPIGSDRVAITTASGVLLSQEFGGTVMGTDGNSQQRVNTFEIPEGNTASFTITTNVVGSNAQQRAVLYGLEWGTTDSATLSNVYTTDMGVNGIYKTPFVYVPM